MAGEHQMFSQAKRGTDRGVKLTPVGIDIAKAQAPIQAP